VIPLARLSRRWLIAGLALVALAALAAGPLLRGLVARRIASAAATRGLEASWSKLRLDLALRCRLEDLVLTRRASGDTVLRAGALSVTLDPWALLLARPRVARADVAHAWIHVGSHSGGAADTLAPADGGPSGPRPGDAERAARLRSTGRSLVRLLAAPARGLPRLSMSDVTLSPTANAGDADHGPEPGLRVRWLELATVPGGIRLASEGAILGEREVPFEAGATYTRDDRLSGGVRFDVPGERTERLRVTLDGALHQDRRAGRVTIADTTRMTIGGLRFRLGAALERGGPRFQLALAADSLTAGQWQSSLPAAVLGPLSEITVRGWYRYRVSLDLDLARPDSVAFAADVEPHGLVLDPARTRLNLLRLDEPFTAQIHLPRERIVERDLSAANPHFRPLGSIDTLLTHAVVTNEDGAFFRHGGFNTEAVKGAIADNVKAGAYRRGAGTITMQLVRNLYLGHARTLSRKAQEVVLAWVLEHLTLVTKERMLEIYLNIIEWGPNVHGADEAAHYYFGHDAGQLTPDEALFLATVIPAPTKWRYRFDEAGALRPFARAQMHFIGRAMIAKGWLAPGRLPAADSLRVELKGPARDVVVPTAPSEADSAAT
jgi:hypothetical protein